MTTSSSADLIDRAGIFVVGGMFNLEVYITAEAAAGCSPGLALTGPSSVRAIRKKSSPTYSNFLVVIDSRRFPALSLRALARMKRAVKWVGLNRYSTLP
jgi:hypothetical protein